MASNPEKEIRLPAGLKEYYETRLPELRRYGFDESMYRRYEQEFLILWRDAQACRQCHSRAGCRATTPGHPLQIHEEGVRLYGEPAFAVAPCARELARREQAWLQTAIRSARLRRTDLQQTFANFRVTEQNRTVYEACLNYARTYQPRQTTFGIVLTGPVGTGKTHLACAILNELRQRRIGGLLKVDVAELLGEMRAVVTQGASTFPLMEAAKEAELLVLDDLGQEYQTEWTRTTVGELINARYADRRPMVITTNLDLEALSRLFTERVSSRLLGMSQVLVLEGDDYRILQHRHLVHRIDQSRA
ncbi:MAG: ATP-binding protein [Limnochordaceae bacterium]|nr:ATP-binding protein [Limnochordaceae bacterium]